MDRDRYPCAVSAAAEHPAMVDPKPRAREMAYESTRDRCTDLVPEQAPLDRAAFSVRFDDLPATLADPGGYGVWFGPIVAGRLPA